MEVRTSQKSQVSSSKWESILGGVGGVMANQTIVLLKLEKVMSDFLFNVAFAYHMLVFDHSKLHTLVWLLWCTE